jgi:predicted O-linked N-acetylglucosamine transferase (SPINDLY family)
MMRVEYRDSSVIADDRKAAAMAQFTIEQALQMASQHHQAGRLAEAEQIYRQVLNQQPNHAHALRLLGTLARQVNRNDAAVDLYTRAIALNPSDAELRNDLAIALSALNRPQEAIAALIQAVRLKPGVAEIHFNLGTLLANTGRGDEAIASFRQALRLKPAYPSALNNLGNSLRDKGQIDEAIAAYSESMRIDPTFHDACNNLGLTLAQIRRYDEAIAVYQQGIRLKPDHALTYYNLAIALGDLGRLDQAIAAYSRALELDPGYADAYNNLGNALKDCGKRDEALACFDRAIALRPEHAPYHSNRLFALHFRSDYDSAALYAEHRQWNQRHAEPLKKLIQPHHNLPDPQRRLKIGFVSPDLMWHPIGRFMLPWLECHDPSAVEIFAYADVRKPDELSQRLQRSIDDWRNIVGLSDDQVAQRIRDDRIDILIDLSMHSARHRLLVFARKPAPVQVTYLAYCSTTGLDTIDYRLTDPYLDPPGKGEPGKGDEYYSEKSIRLPHTHWCYECGLPEPPKVGPLPALSAGHVTFGSTNNFAKVSPAALTAWCRLLAAVPQSHLLLHAREGSHRQAFIESLRQSSIDPGRVRFTNSVGVYDYFRLYQEIDIGLDSFPCAGGTTTCDALWMGVPMVTLAGRTAAGRGGVSLMSNIGLPQFIAHTEDQYASIAAEWASNIPRLAELRQGLRDRMQKSPLMDGRSFARDMEAALRAMWRTWCEKGRQ